MTIERNNDIRRVHFRITNWCNFKCSYCINGLETQVDHQEPTSFYIGHARKLAKILEWLDEIAPCPNGEEIELIGGEISGMELDKICEPLISERLLGFNIVTNMTYYKNLTEFTHWCEKKGVKYVRILASLHEDFMKPEVYFERLNYMRDNISPIATIAPTFVVHDDNLETAEYYMSKVNEYGYQNFRIDTKREHQKDADKGIFRPPFVTSKTLDWVEKHPVKMTFNHGYVVDGWAPVSREKLTNATNGRYPTIGWLCKDRDRIVRYDYKRGLRFGCGITKDSFEDVVCPFPCSLCSAATITSPKETNKV